MAPVSPPLLSIKDVTKTFDGNVRALTDVSLEIERGSFTSLIGASGCGKSTLLRIIAGLIAPTDGSVSSKGLVETGQVGFVFQDPTLMPWATVQKNVALPLELLKVDERERNKRITWALDLVGLGEFASAFPRTLSGGMKMRVSLARALVSRPKLLLLDEPFAALDELTRAKLNEDLLRIWRDEELTVVFVTHSVFESVFLSTRVIVLSPRPGRPVSEFTLPKTKIATEDWRLSSEYSEQCRDVSQGLRTAMEVTQNG